MYIISKVIYIAVLVKNYNILFNWIGRARLAASSTWFDASHGEENNMDIHGLIKDK